MGIGIAQIVAVGLVAAILAITIKSQAPEFAFVISIAASVLIFVMIFPQLNLVIEALTNLAGQVNADMSYVGTVLKIVGIAYISEFGAQICTDAGESAIASKIEIGGKVIIMALSIPILLTLIDLIMTMLPG